MDWVYGLQALDSSPEHQDWYEEMTNLSINMGSSLQPAVIHQATVATKAVIITSPRSTLPPRPAQPLRAPQPRSTFFVFCYRLLLSAMGFGFIVLGFVKEN